MPQVQGSIAFLPRFTTLIGTTDFATAPIDVSNLNSVQLQIWRGALRGTTPMFAAYVEESLDAENWSQGPSASVGYDPGPGQAKFINYCFQLRWFRVRIHLTGTDPMVTCWAEGLLR